MEKIELTQRDPLTARIPLIVLAARSGARGAVRGVALGRFGCPGKAASPAAAPTEGHRATAAAAIPAYTEI